MLAIPNVSVPFMTKCFWNGLLQEALNRQKRYYVSTECNYSRVSALSAQEVLSYTRQEQEENVVLHFC